MASGVIKNIMANGVTWTSLNTAETCKYAKKNGFCFINLDAVSNLAGGSWTTIGTLPTEYRPSIRTYFLCGDGGSNSTLVEIETTGVVRAKPYASGTHYAYGIVVYPL